MGCSTRTTNVVVKYHFLVANPPSCWSCTIVCGLWQNIGLMMQLSRLYGYGLYQWQEAQLTRIVRKFCWVMPIL